MGEDEVSNFKNIGITPNLATIRFHLHHDINPIKLQNGNVLLQNKAQNVLGRFITSSNNVEIKKTLIYEHCHKFISNQIIIFSKLDEIRRLNKLTINWSFKF